MVYQVPEGSVTSPSPPASSSSLRGKQRAGKDDQQRFTPMQEKLFEFETLSDYLIPKAALCGRLITCTTRGCGGGGAGDSHTTSRSDSRSRSRPRKRSRARAEPHQQQPSRHYKVLSYPVLIEDSAKYQRNTFIFNLAFVFDGKADVKSYEPVVRKCARALRGLEESMSFLSSPVSQPRIYGIVEQMFQDLNTYCESFLSLPEAPHTKYVKGGNTNASAPGDSRATKTPSANMEAAIAQARLKDAAVIAMSTSMSKSVSALMTVGGDGGGGGGGDDAAAAAGEQETPAQVAAGYSGPSTHPQRPRRPTLTLPPSSMPPSDPSPSLAAMISERRGSTASASPTGSLVMARSGSMDGGVGVGIGRRGSSGSSVVAGGRRPTISRAKTVSTAAVDETQVSGGVVSKDAMSPVGAVGAAPEMQRVMSASSASSSSSASSMGRRGSATRHTVAQSSSRDESIQAIAADLSSSLMSLRTVENGDEKGEVVDSGDPLLSLLPRPPTATLPAEQREAAHGLGRTVREAINLKLFPTYANPPPVNDWDVPVSLLDLGKMSVGQAPSALGSSWDLTMASIYPFVDGINHVKRISQLADADLELTRQCMEHLLYYGCVLMVDIFQFANVYTLKPAIARLADDPSIQAECGAYVTRPGYAIPSWPALLDLYTALRPGWTLDEWIEDRGPEEIGIDARRFVTFGIIKGFLRRMHRYPVLIGGVEDMESGTDEEVRRASRILRQATIGGHPTAVEQRRANPVTVSDSANVAFEDAAGGRAGRRSSLKSAAGTAGIYDELPLLLDGSHCDDELCVRFGLGWTGLRRALMRLGGGGGGGNKRTTAAQASSTSTSAQRPLQQQRGKGKGSSGLVDEWPFESAQLAGASGFVGDAGQQSQGMYSGVNGSSGIAGGSGIAGSSGIFTGSGFDSRRIPPSGGGGGSSRTPRRQLSGTSDQGAAAADDYGHWLDDEDRLAMEEAEERRADAMEKRGAFGNVALLLL